MRVYIEGIGIAGPGLAGWAAAKLVLAGEQSYHPSPVLLHPVAALPSAERRRTGAAVKLAFATGIEAVTNAGRAAADMATVFASSGGDGDTIHDILQVLTAPPREVSPTRFHNSVHNAPSGYWAVATGARSPSTSICAFDASFAAGLLDAAAQAVADGQPVTLIAYDLPYPEPLHAKRRIGSVFAAALVLTPHQTAACLAALDIRTCGDDIAATKMANPALEDLRLGNPAARSLPLLAALVRGNGTVFVEWLDGACLRTEVIPL